MNSYHKTSTPCNYSIEHTIMHKKLFDTQTIKQQQQLWVVKKKWTNESETEGNHENRMYIYWKTKRVSTIECKGRKNYKHAYTENEVGVEVYIFTTQKISLYKFTLLLGFYIYFYILTFNNDVTCHSMDQLYLNLPLLLASLSALQIPFFIHI